MQIITGKHISRRMALGGMGATVALPFLDAMVPAGQQKRPAAVLRRLSRKPQKIPQPHRRSGDGQNNPNPRAPMFARHGSLLVLFGCLEDS